MIACAFHVAASAGCVGVATDRITAGDLSAVHPLFQALDPASPIGFAPMPGTQRVLSGRELRIIARQHGVALEAGTQVPDVCVTRIVRAVSSDEWKAALVAAVGMPEAEIELVDFSRQPMPPGRLEFSRGGLNKPPPELPATPVIWRGKLIYDGQHSLNVWAKVKITAELPALVAAEDIPVGAVIRPEQIRQATMRAFPFSGATDETNPAAVAGKVARRTIPAGQKFAHAALRDAYAVDRGDKIRVRGIDGLAVVSFEGTAASAGNAGDTILVRNPSSGHNFRAVVEQKGKAVARATPDK